MTLSGATPTVSGAVALLERAIGYTLGSLRLVTPSDLTHPTPCRAWDLRALLVHMNDSLLALEEAGDFGAVRLEPPGHDPDQAADLVGALRDRACRMLGAWATAEVPDLAFVGGCPVPVDLVAGAGALEIVVHGWDVAVACGQPRPLPAELAAELLASAPHYVTPGDRPVRFAAVRPTSPDAGAGERLLAFLGRDPST